MKEFLFVLFAMFMFVVIEIIFLLICSFLSNGKEAVKKLRQDVETFKSNFIEIFIEV